MRLVPAMFCSTALVVSLSFAAVTTGAPAKKHTKMHSTKSSSKALIAQGKALMTTKRCNGCHNADLKGKVGFSPSLYASAEPHHPMAHYTQAQFVTLMTTAIDDDGKKVGPPMSMACKQTVPDSKAMFAYLKTLK